MTKRIYFLDNLKWFTIWLMVVFHGAMCYMAYAPDWWYVVDTAEPVFSATAFICWADIFIMPVMFFVSGFFGANSLARHGEMRFWRGKFTRIVLPWVFGSMVLAPLITYLILASRHSPMGFGEFYRTLFWGPLYEQAQFWYLGALLALYGLLCLAAEAVPSLLERNDRPECPSPALPLGLMLASVVSIGCVSLEMHPDTWRFFAYLLVLQPVRIVTYIAVFFTGVWAWRSRWFSPEGYVPALLPWGTAFLLTGAVYLYQKFCLPFWGLEQLQLVWVNAACQGIFTISATFFFLGLFARCLDFTNPLLSSLSATSYGVYYLHMEVLFPVAWLFVGVELNVYLKYLCVCFISLLFCYLGSKYLLNKLPCFGSGK